MATNGNGLDQLGTIQFPEPTIQPTQVQPSGFQSKAGSLAMFADKFLEGVSRGRALAFQRSEQQRSQSLLGLRSAIQDVQNANIPDEMKQKQLAPLQETYARLVANVGGDQGKSKGKKGGGQSSSDDGTGHPMQGFTDAIKGFAQRMLGPGKQNQAVSPQDVNSIVGQTYASLKSTPTIPAINQNLDQNYATIYNAQAAARGKKVLTQSEQLGIPSLAGIASQSGQLNNGKPSSVIAGFLGSGAKQEEEESPSYLAGIEEKRTASLRNEAEAERARKEGGYYERGGTAGEKATQYKGSDGKIYESRGGKVYPLGGDQPLSRAEIDKANPQPYTKPTAEKMTSKVDKDGNLQVVNLTTGKTTTVRGVKFDTPGQLQAAREAAEDARSKAGRDHGKAKAIATTRSAFDRELEHIKADQNIPDENTRQALMDQVYSDRNAYEKGLQSEDEAPPAENKSSSPPSGSRPPLSSFDKRP